MQHIVPATIAKISQATSTVKVFLLDVSSPSDNFSFFPGQWVDFFIPGLKVVGGFSITSSPSLLQRSGPIELAVKNVDHPPAKWLHTQGKVGDQVELKIGGEFGAGFDPNIPTLLVAGGVGINPLLSMLRHGVEVTQISLLCYCSAERRGMSYLLQR